MYPYLIHHFLEQAAQKRPEHPFLVQEGRPTSYGEVEVAANRVARLLLGEGLSRGDRVGLLCQNSRFYVENYYGVLKAGGIAVPLNTAANGPTLAKFLSGCGARMLIAGPRFEKVTRQCIEVGTPLDLLAAAYRGRKKTYTAVFYEDPADHSDYYAPDGTSVRKMFLKSPLRYRRISSRFSPRRFHPVLRRYLPHLGVDYAASRGTPVQATADGIVLFCGRKGPNGKMVQLKHGNRYATYYLHLSRYGRGIRKGARVKQGQIIGYVGSTEDDSSLVVYLDNVSLLYISGFGILWVYPERLVLVAIMTPDFTSRAFSKP